MNTPCCEKCDMSATSAPTCANWKCFCHSEIPNNTAERFMLRDILRTPPVEETCEHGNNFLLCKVCTPEAPCPCKHGIIGPCWQCKEGVTEYSGRSHTHCYEQENPPCGLGSGYKRCCVCKEAPKDHIVSDPNMVVPKFIATQAGDGPIEVTPYEAPKDSTSWRDEMGKWFEKERLEIGDELGEEDILDKMEEVVKHEKQLSYEEGKSYWEPSEHHKEVWRIKGYNQGRAELRQELMSAIEAKKWRFRKGFQEADCAIEVKTGALRYVGEDAQFIVETRNKGLDEVLALLRDIK